MGIITVNAVGQPCPVPVVNATRALRSMRGPGILEVLVDNEIAVQNLIRMASGHHLIAKTEKRGESLFAVAMDVASPMGEAAMEEPEQIPCDLNRNDDWLVAIDGETMGRGSEELGKILMKSFLFAVTQLQTLPSTVLLYNGGAKLSVEGSDSLEDLKNLEAQGVEILTCGTCLNYYGLTEKLRVGSVTDMYSIAEKLAGARKVIKP